MYPLQTCSASRHTFVILDNGLLARSKPDVSAELYRSRHCRPVNDKNPPKARSVTLVSGHFNIPQPQRLVVAARDDAPASVRPGASSEAQTTPNVERLCRQFAPFAITFASHL